MRHDTQLQLSGKRVTKVQSECVALVVAFLKCPQVLTHTCMALFAMGE